MQITLKYDRVFFKFFTVTRLGAWSWRCAFVMAMSFLCYAQNQLLFVMYEENFRFSSGFESGEIER